MNFAFNFGINVINPFAKWLIIRLMIMVIEITGIYLQDNF